MPQSYDSLPDAERPATQCLSAEVAAALSERLDSLEKEEKALADKKSALDVYQQQIEKRLSDLNAANTAFTEGIAAHEEARDADIAKLAAIYEGMKPAQASAIIGKMDPKFAAGLLGAMSSEQAAAVVAAMEPETAYLVSVILANRFPRD